MLRKLIQLSTLAVCLVTMSACVSGLPQGQVAMMDINERDHFDNTLNMTDLMALAEKLTDKMLMSDALAEWGDKRPRLVVARIKNSTDDDEIPEEQIYDRIKEIILESGSARIVSKSSNKIDYILHGELNSTVAKNAANDEKRHFRVTLVISDLDGEELGHWSDEIKLGKSGSRPWF